MVRFVVTLAAVVLPVAARFAQPYPAKPIRVVVPLAAGGPGDVLARSLTRRVAEVLGQPIVVDNRVGANTNIGTEAVAKAAPDGYTLLLTASTLTINPSLYASVPYDALRDFAPITLLASTPLVLVVHPSLPVQTVKELIDHVRERPGQLNYGSAGNGSTLHLAGEMFNTIAGVKMVHVPYKAVTGAVNDLLAGQLALMFPGAPIALPHARAGKLRALATTGARRAGAAPELPTVAEAGLAGYEIAVWYGLLAPAGTPTAIVDRLHAEFVRAVNLPETKERWTPLGADPITSTTNSPAEYASFLRADLAKWAKVVKETGARAE